MCGIVAVVGCASERVPPDLADLEAGLRRAHAQLDADAFLDAVKEAVAEITAVDVALRGTPGVRALVGDTDGAARLEQLAVELDERVSRLDEELDAGRLSVAEDEIEAANRALVALKDAVWAVRRDRLPAARAVAALAGPGAGRAALDACFSIQVALAALDRLEVRGRDSAGLHVLVDGHGLDLDDPTIAGLVAQRNADPLFMAGSVRTPGGDLAFVYKTAAEIGELGDNTARLRAQIRDDEL